MLYQFLLLFQVVNLVQQNQGKDSSDEINSNQSFVTLLYPNEYLFLDKQHTGWYFPSVIDSSIHFAEFLSFSGL